MFNKKKNRIIELECLVNDLKQIIEKRDKTIEVQTIEIKKEKEVSNSFAKTIEVQAVELEEIKKEKIKLIKEAEKQKDKIKELEACFKPQETMCEEEPVKPTKMPKKTSKATKKA